MMAHLSDRMGFEAHKHLSIVLGAVADRSAAGCRLPRAFIRVRDCHDEVVGTVTGPMRRRLFDRLLAARDQMGER
jgi:hypothetical protein